MNLAQLKDSLAMDAHGTTKDAAINCGICIICRKKARWYSEAGCKEYLISGTCEQCFDSLFKTDEEVTMAKVSGGSEFIAPNSERAIDEAARLGLSVVFPAADELQIDIDNSADYEVFLEHIKILERHYCTELEPKETPSRSGGDCKHITVKLHHNLSNTERILLQAVLGSDRKREILSLLQEWDGDAHPTLFLEKPAQPLLGTGSVMDVEVTQ